MVYCSIRNCKNRSVKGGDLGFFSFPKEEILSNEWLKYCKPKANSKTGRVCSLHFSSADYNKPLRHILMKESPRRWRQLKPDAIPTINISEISQPAFPPQIKSTSVDVTESSTSLTHGEDITNILERYLSSMKAKQSKTLTNCEEQINISKPIDLSMDITKSNTISLTNSSDQINISQTKDISMDIKEPNISLTDITEHTNVSAEQTICSSQNEDAHPSMDHDYTYIEPICILNTDDNAAEPTKQKIEASVDNMVTIPVKEYQDLIKTKTKYETVYKKLQAIFTPGQIRCLFKTNKPRVQWSSEDINAAITFRSISPKGYRYMRSIGIPLPGNSTLCKWVAKCELEDKKY